MNSVRNKVRLFVWLLAVATVKTESAHTRVLLKTLNEELLDHAKEKMDLHEALGHKHPSMTNSLLRSKEMEEILNDGDYRAVGGNRGGGNGAEEKVDKKASKTPKALTKQPTAAPAGSPASPPASPGADEVPSKGSSAKSSGPKTLGSGDKSSKEKKGKKGESGGTMENNEDKPQEEEEVLPGSGDANATQIDQEEVFSEHTVERTLGVSAFLFETPLTVPPDSDDYVELLVITDSIMRDIFDWFFKGVSDVMYGYTKVDGCKALAPFLVQCTVNLFFSDEGYLPSSEELTEIVVQELKNGKTFHQEYLTRLHAMKALTFAAATDVVYISTQDAIDAALLAENTQANSNSNEASSRLLTLVLPLVMVSVLFLLVGLFIFRIRRTQRHWEHILDPNENIMKHKDRDMEEGTTAGETYHISAFSEDATVTSNHFRAGNKKKHTKEILDKQMEQMIHDLEEVSLASSTSRISEKDSVDSDDSSMSAIPRPHQQNKTMTVVLDQRSKPAWATRSTSQSVASRESSSGWTSKAESIASTIPAVKAKKPYVDQNGDNLVRFKKPVSPILGKTTESIAISSNSPNGEMVADFSYTLNAKQALPLPVLKFDQDSDIDTNDLLAEISSDSITAPADPQIDQREPSELTSKAVGLASSLAASDIKQEPNAEGSIEKLTDGPGIDSTKPVQLATKAKPSTPRTNKATAPTATASDEVKMNQPDWTKARLRPVPKPAMIGTDESGSNESAPSSPQPEWMMKFKQMGLDKQLEDD